MGGPAQRRPANAGRGNKMMKTTREFTISTDAGPMRLSNSLSRRFRVAHRSAEWQRDVETRSAVIQVCEAGEWVDYMTIRSADEVRTIEEALRSTPITTKTPAQAEVEKILERYFPDIAHRDTGFEPQNSDALDFPDVFIGSLAEAVAAAFAAGRDFEGRRRDKRAQRDEAKAR